MSKAMAQRYKEHFVKRQPEDFGGGRLAPYNVAAIKTRMCSRAGCGRPAHATWQACCDGRVYRPLCAECDIDLNRMALQWWGDPNWEAKIFSYANDVQTELARPLELAWLVRASETPEASNA